MLNQQISQLNGVKLQGKNQQGGRNHHRSQRTERRSLVSQRLIIVQYRLGCSLIFCRRMNVISQIQQESVIQLDTVANEAEAHHGGTGETNSISRFNRL